MAKIAPEGGAMPKADETPPSDKPTCGEKLKQKLDIYGKVKGD